MGNQEKSLFAFGSAVRKWIEQNCTEPMLGVHLLLVPSYNYRQIIQFVSKIATACAAETWRECAVKLQRLGSWEFEDYSERR